MTPQERHRNVLNVIAHLKQRRDCALNRDTRDDLDTRILAMHEMLRAAQITTILLDHLATLTEEAAVANRLGDNDMYNEVLP